ncbi:MAG: carboxymuconolactone decarboxylase family protein [Paracoccaceae bacterium]
MSDYAKLFETMMAQGQKMVRDFNPELENFHAKGFENMMPAMPKEFIDMMWGNTFNPDGLDAKSRLMAMIAGMTVQGAPLEPMFKTTVAHALQSGAKEQEIAEVITQMSVLGGLPAMTRALEFAKAVFAGINEGTE